jgi:four helix bundle protein
MRNFKELSIWQRSHQLVLKIYVSTRSFPPDELFGLISQMKRSSSSVPTNIAEGCGRNSDADLSRFLTIASGSISELEYQVLLAKDLGYLPVNLFKELTDEIIEIRKMMYAFIQKLK